MHRDRLAQLWIESEVLRLTNLRAAAKARVGNPGPEGSIAKLALANVNKATYEFCIDLLGADGLVGYDYTFKRPDEAGLEAPLGSSRKMFLRARANSIEGGTSEIMRNILGERILGLPGEPRVDRDLPWSQVPEELNDESVGRRRVARRAGRSGRPVAKSLSADELARAVGLRGLVGPRRARAHGELTCTASSIPRSCRT